MKNTNRHQLQQFAKELRAAQAAAISPNGVTLWELARKRDAHLAKLCNKA